MLPYGRKTPLPFPFSQRSHVGNLRQTLQEKGVIHKRVETAGVPSFLPPPRARQSPALRRAQLPAESQRKTPRPLRANTLTQFEYPTQPVLKKLPPVRGEHACAVRVPRSAGAEKAAAPSGTNPSSLWFSTANKKHRRPPVRGVLFYSIS